MTKANTTYMAKQKPVIPDLGLLLKAVRQNEFISKSRLHGEQHWKRVTLNGLWIADQVQGADKEVIFLFGLLHDCRRQNDGADLSHGPRAAKAAENFHEAELINLEPDRLEILVEALKKHTFSPVSDNPTIGCCWDADRYDLLRLFKSITPDKLSHQGVVTPELLDSAYYSHEAVRESWPELLQQV